jgi:hypothetical protein
LIPLMIATFRVPAEPDQRNVTSEWRSSPGTASTSGVPFFRICAQNSSTAETFPDSMSLRSLEIRGLAEASESR